MHNFSIVACCFSVFRSFDLANYLPLIQPLFRYLSVPLCVVLEEHVRPHVAFGGWVEAHQANPRGVRHCLPIDYRCVPTVSLVMADTRWHDDDSVSTSACSFCRLIAKQNPYISPRDGTSRHFL